MSQFLTINKLEGHMIVKQGVFVVKASKFNSLYIFYSNYFYAYRSASQGPLQIQVQHIFLTLTFIVFRRL